MSTAAEKHARTPVTDEVPSRDHWLILILGFAALALLVSIAGIGLAMRAIDESGDGGSDGGGGTTAAAIPTVRLIDLKIEPSSISAPTGAELPVVNDGAMPHNLAVEGKDLSTPMFDAGGRGSLSLASLEPGEYTVFCAVPGHREAGMEGSLEVTEAETAEPGANAGQAGKTGGAGGEMSADEMDEVMAARTKAFPAKTKGQGGQLLAPTMLPDGTKQFDLTTASTQWEIEPGKFVEAMTYNGTVPGPTIKVTPGDKVKVVLKNEMKESTALHLHGIVIPNELDGVPDITQPPIKPGQSFTYEFTAQSTPAVGMYHSHHNAAKQVGNGLAGAYLIGDVPVPGGTKVAAEHTMMLNDTGTIGFSLNGKSFPATAPIAVKQGDSIVMHYMNEGVMAHPMHLHGLVQTVIAKDGFPIAPYKADTVNVAPGERYTVLVTADLPGVWAWHCHILPHAERDDGMFGMVTAMVVK